MLVVRYIFCHCLPIEQWFSTFLKSWHTNKGKKFGVPPTQAYNVQQIFKALMNIRLYCTLSGFENKLIRDTPKKFPWHTSVPQHNS